MPRVVVNVMPKPEILDPQGKAVLRALGRIGVTGASQVRQGSVLNSTSMRPSPKPKSRQ